MTGDYMGPKSMDPACERPEGKYLCRNCDKDFQEPIEADDHEGIYEPTLVCPRCGSENIVNREAR